MRNLLINLKIKEYKYTDSQTRLKIKRKAHISKC